jgi:NAD(P)H dehydrogenase (quinone)
VILVTGASGCLAGKVVDHLHRRGADVVGGSRTPADGMRRVDFERPDELDFRGANTLVLVSAGRGEDDIVIGRHRAAIAAAQRAGVGHIVYTSLTTAGDHLILATAHRATERLIRESGMAWTILRNGMYAEAFAALLSRSADSVIESPYGEGALAAVARDDLAEAAAAVAAAPAPHAGAVYDLVGQPMTTRDVARELGADFRTIGLTELRGRLQAQDGLSPEQCERGVSIASNVRHGFLAEPGPDLARLIERPLADPVQIAARICGTGR